MTPNAAGGVDFLRSVPCQGASCFSGSDFTNVQFAPAAGQSFGVGTYSQAQRISKVAGSSPGLFADEQGRNANACLTITGSYVIRELQRAADGSILKFAADFEQHCRGQASALLGGVRFNSDVPYVPKVGYATASMRYTSDPGDPLGNGATNSYVVFDGHTSTAPSTRHAVHIELQASDAVPIWVLNFTAPDTDPIQPGPYGTAPYPQVAGQPSLTVFSGSTTCATNTASFLVYDIAWSDTNDLVRFAADITVTCGGATGSLNAGIRYNSTVPYVAPTLTSATSDLPEGTATLSIQGTTATCALGPVRMFYPAATQLAAGLPKYVVAPYGAFEFTTQGCGAGRAVVFNVDYPKPLPPTAQWWKFGPTIGNSTPHWYAIPSQVSGNHIGFTIIDGNEGDNDLTPNDVIHDIGLLAIPGGLYQDLWWSGPAEDGWGMTIVQHGDILFTNLFVYDASGNPVWYVMPSGSWDVSRTVYTGNVYLPKGSPYYAYDGSKFNIGPALGTAALTFADANTATLDYNISGATGHKAITRILFGPDAPPTDFPMGDLWWAGLSQNGWGLAVLQQLNTLFTLWFTYDANGNATWFVMPSGQWAARNDYRGTIYKSTGSAWLGVPYDASRHSLTSGGTFRFQFGSDASTFTYTLDGRNGTIPLSRIPF